MPRIIFPEYRDQFKSTKYPFVDEATLTSVEENLTLPQDVFCDASIYIPGAVAPVYIQKINISSIEKTITVSDYSKQFTATGVINPLSDSISLISHEHQVGILVAPKDLTYFTSISYGEYEFTARDTSFAPRCVVMLQNTGVTSVGIEGEAPLPESVWLVGKQGIILRYVEGAIRVDIVGEPLFKREDPLFVPPKFVQTINGISSDEYGNFRISVLEHDDVLRIDNSADGITIYAAGV